MQEPMTPPASRYNGDATWTLGRSDASLGLSSQLDINCPGGRLPNLRSPLRNGPGGMLQARQLPMPAWEASQHSLRSAALTPRDRVNADAIEHDTALADAVQASASAMVGARNQVTELKLEVATVRELLDREGQMRAQNEARLAGQLEQLRLDTGQRHTEAMTSLRVEFSDMLDSFGRKFAELKSQVAVSWSQCGSQEVIDQYVQPHFQLLSDRVDVLCRTAVDMEAVNSLLDEQLMKHMSRQDAILDRVAKLEAINSEQRLQNRMEELSSSGMQRLGERLEALAGKHAKSLELHGGLEQRLNQLSRSHDERHEQVRRDHGKDAEGIHKRLEELGKMVDSAMDSHSCVLDKRLQQLSSTHDDRHSTFSERQASLEEKLRHMSQDHSRHSEDVHRRVEELGKVVNAVMGKHSQGLESHSNLVEQRLKQLSRSHDDRHTSVDKQIALMSAKHEEHAQSLQARFDDQLGQLSQNHDRNGEKLHARIDELQKMIDAAFGKHSQGLDMHANSFEQRLRQLSGKHEDRHSALESKFGQFSDDLQKMVESALGKHSQGLDMHANSFEQRLRQLSGKHEDRHDALESKIWQLSDDHGKNLTNMHKRLDEIARLVDNTAGKHAEGLEAHGRTHEERHRLHDERHRTHEERYRSHEERHRSHEDRHRLHEERLAKLSKAHDDCHHALDTKVGQFADDHSRQISNLHKALEELGKNVSDVTGKHTQGLEAHGRTSEDRHQSHEERLAKLAKAHDDRHSSLEAKLGQFSDDHGRNLSTIHKRLEELGKLIDATASKHAQGLEAHGRAHDDRHRSHEDRVSKLSEEHAERMEILQGRLEERLGLASQTHEERHAGLDERLKRLVDSSKENTTGIHNRIEELGRHHGKAKTDMLKWEQRLTALSDKLEALKPSERQVQLLREDLDELSGRHASSHASLEERIGHAARLFEDKHSSIDDRLSKLGKAHEEHASGMQKQVEELKSLHQTIRAEISKSDQRNDSYIGRRDVFRDAEERYGPMSRTHDERVVKISACFEERLGHISRLHEDRHNVMEERLKQLAKGHKDHSMGVQASVEELSKNHGDIKSDLLVWEQRFAMLSDRYESLKQVDRQVQVLSDRVEHLDGIHTKGWGLNSAYEERMSHISRTHDERYTNLDQSLGKLSRSHDERYTNLDQSVEKLSRTHDERYADLDQSLGKLSRTHEESYTNLDQNLRKLTKDHDGHVMSMKSRMEELTKSHASTKSDLMKFEQRLASVLDRLDSFKPLEMKVHHTTERLEALSEKHAQLSENHQGLESRFGHHASRYDDCHSSFEDRLTQLTQVHDEKLGQISRGHDDRSQMLQARTDERYVALDQRLVQLSQSHKEHADGHHKRVDELGRLHSGLKNDMLMWEQRLRSLSDRFDTVKHVDPGLKSLNDRVEVLTREHRKHREAHSATQDMLKQMNDQHHERHDKHAQNAAALENGLADNLDKTHKKLQEELALLKSGVDGSHGNLREIVMEVTKQVDNLDQSLVKEQQMRLAVEERLDKSSNELRRFIDGHLHAAHERTMQVLQERLQEYQLERLALDKDHVTKVSNLLEERHGSMQKRCEALETVHEHHVSKVSDLLDERHNFVQKRLEAIERLHEQNMGSVRERIEGHENSVFVQSDGRHSKLNSRLDHLEKAHDQNMDMVRARIEELATVHTQSSKGSADWEERFGALGAFFKREIARIEAATRTGQEFREALDTLAGKVGVLSDGLSAEMEARDGLAQSVERLFQKLHEEVLAKMQEDSRRQQVESHLQRLREGEMQLLQEMKGLNDNMAQEINRAVFCHPAEEAGGAGRATSPRLPPPLSVRHLALPAPTAVAQQVLPQVSSQAQPDPAPFAASVPVEVVTNQDAASCRICGSTFMADALFCRKCGCKRPVLENSPGMIRTLRSASSGDMMSSGFFQ